VVSDESSGSADPVLGSAVLELVSDLMSRRRRWRLPRRRALPRGRRTR
jgi:hypothetical protein